MKIKQKRGAPSAQTSQSAKKRKVDNASTKRTAPKKERAAERKTIPIPVIADDDDDDDEQGSGISEVDLEYFADSGNVGFLKNLDVKGIAMSKSESKRLKKLSKPTPAKHVDDDDLPSINSHFSDDDFDSDIPEDETSSEVPDAETDDSDIEQAYENQPRPQQKLWENDAAKGAERLPVKLADGTIKKRGNLPAPAQPSESELSESDNEDEEPMEPRSTVEDVSTGARFGRPSVTTVISTKSRKARIQAAKEQLAGICQEIIGDPENSLGLLRRLHSFALPSITTPANPKPVPNDPTIRKLAFISQLAVFKDIVPGYRIRPLTEHEKAEKVSQMVQRTRDYEQGLVAVYQQYLQVLETELKSKSELAEVALQCMCTLLEELTHFNYRVNLMSAIVARLSKKSWDKSSDLCVRTLIAVLRKDNTGTTSLEVVRLLNRMIKERHFKVHPLVLSPLTCLRLKSELGGVRASSSHHENEGELERKQREKREAQREMMKRKERKGKRKGKFEPKVHLTKNAKKVMKENKEIEDEMMEAEAEVDREERSKVHTETLKLLFVLYFRILKNPRPTPLLSAALEGITKFAHLVNVDFFKDLLAVLKTLALRDPLGIVEDAESDQEDNAERQANSEIDPAVLLRLEEELRRQKLMCIVTAFELLSGQGEALVIDLSDFVNYLYAVILELSLASNIEDSPLQNQPSVSPQATSHASRRSLSDLLFRALTLIFMTRASAGQSPPWRAAAFAKRLLSASLQWPPATTLKTLELVKALLVKHPELDAMLSTEDRVTDGVYRGDMDDPQMCNPFATSFWELRMLERMHWDEGVRKEARKLANFTR